MTKPATIVFLFNHDAAHQAAHVAGTMAALALDKGSPPLRLIAAVGTPEIAARVQALIGAQAAERIEWLDLTLPLALDRALKVADNVLPARRLARLRLAEKVLAEADIVVSPERTCLRARARLRNALGDAAPPFVFVPHGAGDRSVTYHPALAQFDWFLVSGTKVRDEMIAHGLSTPERCLVTGYAKFDTVADAPSPRLFDNDRPVIVYNPHFDPRLSSWYDHGPELLERVARMDDRFNLIFAPHVMLFRKKLHISPEYRVVRQRPEVPAIARRAGNILLDCESPRLFDMTYTRAADIYVGDVSSQIYEFLSRPRAAFFLDAANQGADAYQFWGNGPVVRSIDRLLAALADWRAVAHHYRAVQQQLFAYTMDVVPGRSASQRGAEALRTILAANV